MQVTLALIIAAIGVVIIQIAKNVHNYWYHARKAKELGCQPAPPITTWDISGISSLIAGIKAGNKRQFPVWFVDNFDHMTEKLGRPAGSYSMVNPFFRRTVFTNEPKNIQAILATQFKDFGLGINRTGNLAPLFGTGIFAANGKQWEHARAMMRPQFTRSQVNDLELEETHVVSLMSVLERSLKSDGWTDVVDLQTLFFNLTIDSATEFLFGESINSQLETADSAAANRNNQFAVAFDRAQFHLSITTRLGPNYKLGHTSHLWTQINIINEFANRFVQQALNKSEKDLEKQSIEGKYVFLDELTKTTRDPTELRDQLLNILLAGRDTTAGTLGWFFFLLADPQYESVFTKLRGIILETFGTYSNPREITFETIKNCQYLQWCINEVLRLYPAVPFNTRSAMVDATLPTGGGEDGKSPIYIKKGDDISYSVFVMHRRKDLWGEDAETFRPERWEGRRPGWEYLPFNGGPRICIGQQFALTEISYVVIRMLQRIDKIDGSTVGPVSYGLSFTSYCGEGVKVKLHFRE